jgi:hypothetical protein
MSEESTFRRDYIRLTERFKALSTFDQFLQGIHRAFFPVRSGAFVDLDPLYKELKLLSSAARAGSGDPPPQSFADVEARFDAAAAELRAADISLSPSLTRRYFEKVRPYDPRIPFYLIRFYSHQGQTDEDLLDKVDYLATVVAAGSPDPAAPVSRPRAEVRKLFDAVLMDSAWPRVDDDTAPQIAEAFDEITAQIASSAGFGSLAEEGWIESLRNFKRRVCRGLSHPEILTSAALCNLTARAVFRRLYETEERVLRGAAHRIGELEQRSPAGELEDAAALRLFQESRREFDRQVAEGSVRWRQLLEVRHAASEALKMLGLPEPWRDEEIRADSESKVGGLEDPFWGPCLRRFLSALGDGGAVPVEGSGDLSQWRLETWETDAARRMNGGQSLSRGEYAVLSAAALRIKAEEETESTRKGAASRLPDDLLRDARQTLAHALELDRSFTALAGAVQSPDESGEQARCWTRTRMRLLHATSALWLALDGSGGEVEHQETLAPGP